MMLLGDVHQCHRTFRSGTNSASASSSSSFKWDSAALQDRGGTGAVLPTHRQREMINTGASPHLRQAQRRTVSRGKDKSCDCRSRLNSLIQRLWS